MMPDNYVRVMYVKFDDGETMYHRPHHFRILDLLTVSDYYSVYVPVDSYEARAANYDTH